MGEPAMPSDTERLATRTLAALIVECVRDDEAIPLPGVYTPSPEVPMITREGVELLVFRLAQEVDLLSREVTR